MSKHSDMVGCASIGVEEVDKMMGGGLIPGNAYLMEVEPGTGELAFIACYLSAGLSRGEFCTLIVYDMPHEELVDKLMGLGVDVESALDSGSLIIADLSSEGKYDPEHKSPFFMTENLADPNSILRIYYDLADERKRRADSGKYAGSRVVIYSISSAIMNYRFEPTYKLARIGLSLVRKEKTISLTIIDPKMFDGNVIAAFEHLNDGIIALNMKDVEGRFRKFIRVKRSPIGSFHTDAVPYEVIGDRPSLVTSFGEPMSTFRNQLKLHVDGTYTLMGSRVILTNATVTQDITKHLADIVGYERAFDNIYGLFKVHGQTLLRRLLSSSNIAVGTMDPRRLLEFFSGYISAMGSGMVKIASYSDTHVSLRIADSVCRESPSFGKPMNPYLAGIFAGVIESILNKPVKCIETKCMARGDECCELTYQFVQ